MFYSLWKDTPDRRRTKMEINIGASVSLISDKWLKKKLNHLSLTSAKLTLKSSMGGDGPHDGGGGLCRADWTES